MKIAKLNYLENLIFINPFMATPHRNMSENNREKSVNAKSKDMPTPR